MDETRRLHERISELEQLNTELRSSEERLKILFEHTPDGYYLSDLKGTLIHGNETAEEITGYRREELIGKSFLKLKLLSTEQMPRAAALLAKNALGKSTGPDEFTLNRKDGSTVPVEIHTYPVRIGGQCLTLGIVRDVSARKQAENVLRERVKELTCLHQINHAMQQQPAIDVLCRQVVQLVVITMQFPEIAVVVIELDGSRYTSKGYTEGLSHGLHSEIRAGKKGFGRLSAYYTKDKPFLIPEEQNLLNTVGEDLGLWIENQHTKKEINRLSSAVDQSISAVALADLEGNLTYVNPSFLQFWGYDDAKEVLGKPVLAFWYLEDKASEVMEALRRGEGWIGELAAKKKDGSAFFVHLVASMVANEAGRPVCTIASFLDITKRKKMEEELRQTIKMKSEFYSHVSHELRNPLNFILGYAQLLSMEGNLNDVQKRFVENILAGGERLVPLIEDFFELSKLDSGHITLKRESQPLKPLLSLVDQDHQLAAQAKGIQLTFHDEGTVDDEAILDVVKFRQAMDNLVGNAIKYTPKGGKVSVTLTKGANQFAIRIADTGVGIAPKDHDRIFQEFIRVENNESSDEGMVAGTGLGLPIAKRIINLHGGSINLQSELGEGATFTVTIPAGGEDDKNTSR